MSHFKFPPSVAKSLKCEFDYLGFLWWSYGTWNSKSVGLKLEIFILNGFGIVSYLKAGLFHASSCGNVKFSYVVAPVLTSR